MTSAPPLGPRWWTLAALWACLIGAALTAPNVHAEPGYTPADTTAAIHQASLEIGVSEAWLTRTIDCETGGTFDPASVGKQGELGAAQLHPSGELLRFYAWGYLDPRSPYQAVRFMAQRFSMGGSGAWTCS